MKKIFILLFIALSTFTASAQQHVNKGATRYAVLSQDTTNATIQLVSTPLTVTLDSNSTWAIEGMVFTGSSSAAGIALAFDFPTGDTLRLETFGTDSTISQFKSEQVTADSVAGVSRNNANAQTGWVQLKGTIVCAGATGPFDVCFKKLTSGTATLGRKSWIKLTKIR